MRTVMKPRGSRRGMQAVLLFSLAVLLFLIPVQGAASEDPRTPGSLAEAKKEGKLVWYGSLNMVNVSKFLKHFHDKYPFIKVQYVRIGSTAIPTRVKNEYRGGVFIPDVIGTSAFPLYAMIKDDVLGRYFSPQRKGIPSEFYDTEGYWSAWLATLYAVSYNTKLLSSKEAPRSYDDLLNPKYKGKISMVRDDVKWFMGMLQYMGEEKGLVYMRKLAQQNITIYGFGHSQMANLLAAREFPIALCIFPDQVEDLKGDGAPVEWIRTEPLLTMPSLISMAAKPSHPNAAKIFIDYVLSAEGQRAVVDSGLRRVATIPRSDADSDGVSVTEPLKLFPVDPALGERLGHYEKLWQNVFYK